MVERKMRIEEMKVAKNMYGGYDKFVFAIQIIFLSIIYVCMQRFLYLYLCNSDWASENLIAHTLYEEKKLISQNIYYNSEIRFLDEQLLQAILFFLGIESWKYNRILANTICFVAILIVMEKIFSTLDIVKSRKYTFLTGIIMICPFSYAYADAYTYGGFYLWKMFIALIMIYVFLQTKHGGRRSWILSCLIAFYSGIYGIRLLLVVIIPLLTVDMLYRWKGEDKTPYILSWGICTGALMGYAVNTFICKKYSVQDMGALKFVDLTQKTLLIRISEIADKILEFAGYISNAEVFSLNGIHNLLAIIFFAGNVIVLLSVYKIYKGSKELWYVQMALVSLGINSLAMILTDMSQARYFIFNFMLLVPVYALYLNRKKFLTIPIMLCFLLAGFSTIVYKSGNGGYYEWQIPNSERMQSINFLEENNYRFGYASYWNANIITEFTDGDICVSGFWNLDAMEHFKWNSLKKYEDPCLEKVFLLLTNVEAEKLTDRISVSTVYRDDVFTIYEYPTTEAYIRDMGE